MVINTFFTKKLNSGPALILSITVKTCEGIYNLVVLGFCVKYTEDRILQAGLFVRFFYLFVFV